jgi:hypothetical protein
MIMNPTIRDQSCKDGLMLHSDIPIIKEPIQTTVMIVPLFFSFHDFFDVSISNDSLPFIYYDLAFFRLVFVSENFLIVASI